MKRGQPKTPAERNRARDIRAAIKKWKAGKGKPVSAAALRWEAEYRATQRRSPILARDPELEETPPPPRKPPPPAPKKSPPPPVDDEDDDEEDDDDDDDEPRRDPDEDAPPRDDDPRDAPPKRRRLSFDDDDDGDETGEHDEAAAERCTIPNCPSCKSVLGSMKCGTTGERVWEPVDDDMAEGLAEGALTLIGVFARLVRPDHARIEPSERETERMTKAAKKMAHRRANWLGEYEDLALAGFTVVAYGKRALTELPEAPAREEKDAPPAE